MQQIRFQGPRGGIIVWYLAIYTYFIYLYIGCFARKHVQDYSDETRVIIQLLLYHNKSYLLNIPSWDETRDAVVCLVGLVTSIK